MLGNISLIAIGYIWDARPAQRLNRASLLLQRISLACPAFIISVGPATPGQIWPDGILSIIFDCSFVCIEQETIAITEEAKLNCVVDEVEIGRSKAKQASWFPQRRTFWPPSFSGWPFYGLSLRSRMPAVLCCFCG